MWHSLAPEVIGSVSHYVGCPSYINPSSPSSPLPLLHHRPLFSTSIQLFKQHIFQNGLVQW